MCKTFHTDDFLSATAPLFRYIYHVKHDFSLRPSKDHTGCCIDYSDCTELRGEFLQQLWCTITNWVYNKTKYCALRDAFLENAPDDVSNAASQITFLALSKFRRGRGDSILIQGQFGELILFNFLQHFFKAVPLLRKQPITTSVGHERFGADAIHLKSDGQNHELFLGESKVYYAGGLSKAFSEALSSIVTTYNNLREELDLYVYDDFIDEELREFVRKYKNNEIRCPIQLVCFIAYNPTTTIDKQNPDEIRSKIIAAIEENCRRLSSDIFDAIPSELIPKMNYIIFPIWELESLLSDFKRRIGT